MFFALSWMVVLVLIGLWSLSAWALHAASTWAVAHAGALADPAGAMAGAGLDLPAWLAPWIPPEALQMLDSLRTALAPMLEGLLGMMPALAGGLSVAVWVLWALGTVLLVVLGVVAHVLIATVRRRLPGASAQPA